MRSERATCARAGTCLPWRGADHAPRPRRRRSPSLGLLAFALLDRGGGGSAAPAVLASPTLTPGSLNPDVTQATIGSTICVRGWTATVRPPSSYTSPLKLEQMPEYGESGPAVRLPGGPPDQPRARRQPDRPAQPLARAVSARGRRRQDRERAQRQGLLGRAHARRGPARRVGAQARARLTAVLCCTTT